MRRSLVVPFLFAVCTAAKLAFAQSAPTTGKPNHNTYGSPLDTIMSTHLWTDVAPAQDFVRESRPDPRTLDYAPLTGTDPERPKPRDKANVEALQAELEHDRVSNEGHAHPLQGPAKSAARAAANKANTASAKASAKSAKLQHAAAKPAE